MISAAWIEPILDLLVAGLYRWVVVFNFTRRLKVKYTQRELRNQLSATKTLLLLPRIIRYLRAFPRVVSTWGINTRQCPSISTAVSPVSPGCCVVASNPWVHMTNSGEALCLSASPTMIGFPDKILGRGIETISKDSYHRTRSTLRSDVIREHTRLTWHEGPATIMPPAT